MSRTNTASNGMLPFKPQLLLTEKLLQFIWQFGYFNKEQLTTIEGEAVEVFHPGALNTNQGPDFYNGHIRIGPPLFAGTVELHLKTSDWDKHHHSSDAHYKNVILHVVFEHDRTVNHIPVLELGNRVSTMLLETYAAFMNNNSFVACGETISTVKALTWSAWKERLLAERLTRKAVSVLKTLEQTSGHWEETLWLIVARTFGGKVNADAFEAMARSISINLLAKHKLSIHQIEALLFGQSGLLNNEFEEDYPKLLQREYRFLQKKYGLVPSLVPVVFLRMRPSGFPTIRLAQLASMITGSTHLFSKLLETESVSMLRSLFTVTANDYWHYHYRFGEASAYKKKTVGEDAADGLIINAVAPVLFAYGIHHNKQLIKDRALSLLSQLPAEDNAIIKGFRGLGVSVENAFDSQALLELRNEYCSARRCLDCAVGNSILREAAAPYLKSGILLKDATLEVGQTSKNQSSPV